MTIRGQTLRVEEDETGGPAFFWTNPWTGKREKPANLWWPEHPPEATAEVESAFNAMVLSIFDQTVHPQEQ